MTANTSDPGRRERKKYKTRDRIQTVAMALFLERGFDRVTVVQIADKADVAPQTVFNHFPLKEDLVFVGLARFDDDILSAVGEPLTGEGVIGSFRRALLSRTGMLDNGDERSRARLVAINRMIDDSPALRRREERAYTDLVAAIAQLLRSQGGHGVEPYVVANALVGVHRALIAQVRGGVLDGVGSDVLADQVRRDAAAAFDLLERGLGAYPRSSEAVRV